MAKYCPYPSPALISAVMLLCLCLPTNAFAQNATITGTVSDAAGALIPGAEVTATNVNTGIETLRITNETGTYTFPTLQPGNYKLAAALPGFQTQIYENVQLSQNQQARFNFSLQVSALTESVEVTAAADAALTTTAASVGVVLPQKEVASLPLAQRNVLDLISTGAAAVGENFAGQRINEVNTSIDGLVLTNTRVNNGVDSPIFLSPDLVEEVQVVTSSIDAAQGRGTGQVRLQTRSGSNDFHGALFYTNNNSAFQSVNWFNKLPPVQPLPYENRHQFGGRLGGPILRNKAFFFVLYEGQRYLLKESVTVPVLTEQARQGTFRYLTAGAPAGQAGSIARTNGNADAATPAVDVNGVPLTNAAGVPLFVNSFNFFNNAAGVGTGPGGPWDANRRRIDAWIQQQLALIPLPNNFRTGDGLNTAGYTWSRARRGVLETNDQNRNGITFRFDYQPNSANKLFFLMDREKTRYDGGATSFFPALPSGKYGKTEGYPGIWNAGWTATVTSTILNEFRFGKKNDGLYHRSPYFLNGFDLEDAPKDTHPAAQADLLPYVNGYPISFVPATFTLPNRYGQDSRVDRNANLFQFSDSISWTAGAHSFRAGVEYFHTQSDTVTFLSPPVVPSAQPGQGPVPVNYSAVPGIGNNRTLSENIVNDLAGSINRLQQAYRIQSTTSPAWVGWEGDPRQYRHFTQQDWSFYLKDTFQLRTDLTLNLGVRYDLWGLAQERNGFGARAMGGQSGIFGISGKDFSSWFNPAAYKVVSPAAAADPNYPGLTLPELVGPGSPNPDLELHRLDRNNIAPSIGFSWNLPWFGRSTVLRGGYGVNYSGARTFRDFDNNFSNIPGVVTIVTQPLTTYLDLATARPPLAPIQTPIGAVPLTDRAQTFNTFADDLYVPYIQSWNLSVSRELTQDLTLELSYAGNKATGLDSAIQLNEPNLWAAFNGSETFLQAFNTTRSGGTAPLFDRMLNGIRLANNINPVDGTTQTGSAALRTFATTSGLIARGEVAALAQFFNNSTVGTGVPGGLLRTNGFPDNFLYVNPQFNSVQLFGNNNMSNYHSLQTKITKRFSHGLSGQFAHTWSKVLGLTASNGQTVDPRDRSQGRGPLGFDRTHIFRSHASWQLPFGANKAFLGGAPGWVQRFVEQWELAGISTYDSGSPLAFTSGVRTLGVTNNVNFANLVGEFPKGSGLVEVGQNGVVNYFPGFTVAEVIPASGAARDAAIAALFGSNPNNLHQSVGQFRNVVDSSGRIVMSNPSPGQAGNSGAAWTRGPGLFGLDLALIKRVQFDEGKLFTLRIDAINVLNKPQWGNPNVDINSSNFGRITSATGQREFTFNMRVDF